MGGHGNGAQSTANTVTFETDTGSLSYSVPISLDLDAVDESTAQEILAATGTTSSVQTTRAAHQLLGLEVDGRYRYPLFQFAFTWDRRSISPVARHAHEVMECSLDPWGTLDWWFTANSGLRNERPVDQLTAGLLTEADVDRLIALDLQGMD